MRAQGPVVHTWRGSSLDYHVFSTPAMGSLQFDFQSFLDQIKSRAAEPVPKYLRSHVLPSLPAAHSHPRPAFSATLQRERSP